MGVHRATGVEPEYLMGYTAFHKNERHIQHHYADVPFYDLSIPFWDSVVRTDDRLHGLDIVTTVCPCAGLSITSSQSKNHGADSTHNEWMYRTAELVLKHVRPKVMFGENAPGLFREKGRKVAERIAAIGAANGYSFSMVLTDTVLHGVPQKRPRTFYFLWRIKSGKAPRFLPFKRPTPTLDEYLRTTQYPKDGAFDHMEYSRFPLQDDIYFLYMTKMFGDKWRERVEGRTVIDHLKNRDLLPSFFAWCEQNYPDHPQYAEVKRHKANIERNRGLWDESPKAVRGATPAIMFKNVKRIVHPTEDRFLNVRELMHMMGFPVDFQLHLDPNKAPEDALETAMHHISQNVPVATACDMAKYCMDVFAGKIPMSDTGYYMYDNVRQVRLEMPVAGDPDEDQEGDEDYGTE